MRQFNKFLHISQQLIKRFGSSPYSVAILSVAIAWSPLVEKEGIIFQRDPSFYATTGADIAWSLGGFSIQGGLSNVQSQGLFFEPYSLLIWLITHLGIHIGAGTVSKLIPIAFTMIAAGSAFSLAKKFGANLSSCYLAALFFVFNPWSLENFGYFYNWTGYCLLPALVLGTIRISRGEKVPRWLPIITFLGGLISWLIAAIVCLVTLKIYTKGNYTFFKSLAKLSLLFFTAGAYWIIPFGVALVFPSNYFSLSYPDHGVPLQSASPLTDLLQLRDPWWQHLNLFEFAGINFVSISLFATAVLVFSSILYLLFATKPNDDNKIFSNLDHEGKIFLVSLVAVGILLGEGSAGIFGWIYSAVRNWPYIGNGITRSLTREPSRLASPFIFAISIVLAMKSTRLENLILDTRVRVHARIKKFYINATIFILITIVCLPSLIAFWNVYQPISIPSAYSQISSLENRGTSLVIAYYPLNAISPVDGLWHYTWSSRLSADGTLLSAYVRGASLSPVNGPSALLEKQLFSQGISPASTSRFVQLAESVGISRMIIQTDIRLPSQQRTMIDQLISDIRTAGIREVVLKYATIFYLPGPTRSIIWSNSCKVNNDLFTLGLIHINCSKSSSSRSSSYLYSPLAIPTPLIGIGLPLISMSSFNSLGTQIEVPSGGSGWILIGPNVVAAFGGLVLLLLILFATIGGILETIFRMRKFSTPKVAV